MIELELLDARPERVVAHPPAGDAPRPKSPRRGRDLVVIAVAAFVVVAIAAALLRDDGDEALRTPATTSSPTTTAVVPSSLVLPTTRSVFVPGVGELFPTTTIASAPSVAATELNRWLLVGLGPTELSVLDLTTRALEELSRPPEQRTRFHEAPIVVGDRVVYTTNAPAAAVWTQRLRDPSATRLLDRASVIAKSSSAGLFWVVLHEESTLEHYRVAEIDVEGRRTTTLTVPAGLVVAGVHSTGLWLTGNGRIFSMTRAGTVQQIAVGTLVDASLGGVIFDDCAIAGPCSLQLARNTSSRSRIGPTAEIPVPRSVVDSDSMLSPDGRWLMLSNGILDLRTGGQLRHVFRVQAWRWSPDGQWVFLSISDGTMAWNLGDQRLVALNEFGTRVIAGLAER